MSSQLKQNLARLDRRQVHRLFDAISSKYDFLNSFLSLGLESYWRRRLVKGSLGGLEHSILDLGAGTGKSLAAFLSARQFEQVVGCDFSEPMLGKAKERLGSSAVLIACDFHDLPFPSSAFDLVTGSFILRSVEDMNQFLSEVKRVLRPEGKAAFLELTRPTNRLIWNFLYQPYLRFYVPCVGKLFSRHDHAYQFLSQSVQSFSEPEELKRQFESAGFRDLRLKALTTGVVTVIQGKRSQVVG